MKIVHGCIVLLLVALLLGACTMKRESHGVRVICPACGTDFDALYYKRY